MSDAPIRANALIISYVNFRQGFVIISRSLIKDMAVCVFHILILIDIPRRLGDTAILEFRQMLKHLFRFMIHYFHLCD